MKGRSGWILAGLAASVMALAGAREPVRAGAGAGANPPVRALRLHSRTLVPPAERAAALAALRRGGGRHLLVQVDRIPTAAERAALLEAGVRLLDYVPDHGYYASVAGPLDETAPALANIAASWALEPGDRLHPRLRADGAPPGPGGLPRHADAGQGRVHLTLLAFDDADLGLLAARIGALGGTVRSVSPFLRILGVTLPRSLVGYLGGMDEVMWIEPAAPPPRMEMSRARSYLQVDPVLAAPYGLTGAGVEVAVHEFGHAFRHSDYFSRWIQGDAGEDQALSPQQHASMVAGTIAGDGTLDPTRKGMAPGATLVTYSFESTPCCEANNYLDIEDALLSGWDVSNNSWGYAGCNDEPYGDYTTRARVFDRQVLGRDYGGTAEGDPMVVVFSAGNERFGYFEDDVLQTDCIENAFAPFVNYGTINQPKPAKNVIAVGAVDSANDRMTTFSSWGPVSDGRLRPDLVAGGVHNGTAASGTSDITNCFGDPEGSSNQQCYRTTNSSNTAFGGYAWFSETSAAAAMVSGAAALFIQDYRALWDGETPRPSIVKAHLLHAARDLNDSTTWYNPGPDYASGYGLLNAQAAIDQLRSGRFIQGCLDQGESSTVFASVPAGSSAVKVTIVWDDEPAAPSTTAPALVNDLDLVVTDPAGARRYPWTLNPAAPSVAAARNAEDHLNNVEQVMVSSPPAGVWKVKVAGTTVPSGPQCFALVISGTAALADADGDGYDNMLDCDDTRAAVRPGGPAVCDGLNNDCADPYWPAVPAHDVDADGDGLATCGGDCDDADRFNRPGNTELCDRTDNDCDGIVDDELDNDLDGITDCLDLCPLVHDPSQTPYAYMTVSGEDSLVRVNLLTGAETVLASDLGRPQGVEASLTTLYVAESSTGELSSLSIGGGPVTLRDSGLGAPEGIVLRPGSTFAWVADLVSENIFTSSLSGGGTTILTHLDDAPFGLATDVGGAGLWVAQPTVDRIVRVNTSTGVATVAASAGLDGPAGITVNRGGTEAWVTEINAGEVSHVALGTGGVTTLATGLVQPKGIVIAGGAGTVALVVERGTSLAAANGHLSGVSLETGRAWVISADHALPSYVARNFAGSCPANVCNDADGDGHGTVGVVACPNPLPDCDDTNPDRHPGAAEQCNGIDDNCDGAVPASEFDADGDGFAGCEGDCDDTRAATWPGAPEINDGVDNQCPGDPGDGLVDEIEGRVRVGEDGPHMVCWDPQPGATSYQVVRSRTRLFDAVCTSFATGSTCITDAGLPAVGTGFFYAVRPTAPHLGTYGTSDPPSICAGENSCEDGQDNDGDRAADCEDSDCLDEAHCAADMYTFTDTIADNTTAAALQTFFTKAGATARDYIFFSLSAAGTTTDGAWCAARADFYAANYLSPPAGGVAASGSWDKWHRPDAGAWTGPVTTGFPNEYGAACLGTASWCSEQGLGSRYLDVNPAHLTTCEAHDGKQLTGTPPGCSGGQGWVVTLRVGPSRLSTCGF